MDGLKAAAVGQSASIPKSALGACPGRRRRARGVPRTAGVAATVQIANESSGFYRGRRGSTSLAWSRRMATLAGKYGNTREAESVRHQDQARQRIIGYCKGEINGRVREEPVSEGPSLEGVCTVAKLETDVEPQV